MSLEHKTYNFNLINGSKVIRINYIGNNGALDIESAGISFAIPVCKRIRMMRSHAISITNYALPNIQLVLIITYCTRINVHFGSAFIPMIFHSDSHFINDDCVE